VAFRFPITRDLAFSDVLFVRQRSAAGLYSVEFAFRFFFGSPLRFRINSAKLLLIRSARSMHVFMVYVKKKMQYKCCSGEQFRNRVGEAGSIETVDG